MPPDSYPPKDAFHWQDNIFFRLNPNYGGLVECFKHDGQYHHIWAMSLQSWDSIAAFIARGRDSDGTASVPKDCQARWRSQTPKTHRRNTNAPSYE